MRHVTTALARLTTVFLPGTEPRDDLFVEYTRVLGDSDAVLLKIATDELIANSKWMPKPSELLDVVRRLQAEADPRPAAPEVWRRDTYQCPICLDYGWVTVWSPDAMAKAIEHVQGRIPRTGLNLNECAAKCTCSVGQAKPGKAGTLSGRMMRLDRTAKVQDQIAALLEAAKGWYPPNRVKEFDTYNVDAS